MVQLNCFSLDYPSHGHFSLCLEAEASIIKLRKVIHERLKSFYFAHRVDIADPSFYLANDLSVEPTESLFERAEAALQSSPRLVEIESLSSYFPHEPDGKRIHILVNIDEIIRKRADLRKLALNNPVETGLERTIRVTRDALPAYEAALPDRMPSQQSSFPIYNGRSDSRRGPPIAIYNGALAKLKDALEDMSDVEVTAQELKATHVLLMISTKFYHHEGHRMEQIDMPLETLLGFSIVNTAFGDGLIRTRRNGERVILAFLRCKNELGSEGDASYHAACAYREYVASNEYEEVRKRTCSPALIIGLMGPYLCLMGGIFIGETIVQPFTDYIFLGGDLDYGKRVLHIARVFKAMKNALSDLRRYYETSLGDDGNCGVHFPQPAIIDGSIPCPDLHFVERLFPGNMASTLYKAKMNNRDVIVKFTSTYCGDVHRLLAGHELAPALHFCGRIHGGLWMVVMDYVRGDDGNDYLTENGLPVDIAADVKKAVKLLHEKNYVFGDLRPQNILVVEKAEAETNRNRDPRIPNGSSDHATENACTPTTANGHSAASRGGAVLIDFDWCGKESEARYPTTLNDTGDIDWAPGVERFGLIKKEHDEYWLRKLVPH